MGATIGNEFTPNHMKILGKDLMQQVLQYFPFHVMIIGKRSTSSRQLVDNDTSSLMDVL